MCQCNDKNPATYCENCKQREMFSNRALMRFTQPLDMVIFELKSLAADPDASAKAFRELINDLIK